MRKTVVLNVVGLSQRLIGADTPHIRQWMEKGRLVPIEPVLPAVTCSAQATYLTGKWPAEHGIVGNGWYFQAECEIKFWRQSNRLVQRPKIWDVLRAEFPDFSCANLFWWYNMYSTVDYSVTPRPNYLADGRKIPDVYSQPADLRDYLQQELGQFPLFNFWGPNTSIRSSRWIADATLLTDRRYDPTLTLVYLPHLDYNLQRYGHQHPSIASDLREIDAIVGELIAYYEKAGAAVVLLSEYGITDVDHPVHLNRLLRDAGYLALRREQSWELLDAGASRAFAVADHQIAHIYLNDQSILPAVRTLLEGTEGVEQVLDKKEQARFGLNHPRSGDLVAVAGPSSWFTYYYWQDDRQAPDFARTVDIHRKPGYDPVEMFFNPAYSFPMLRAGWKVLKKKMGFRSPMNLIPLDATLVKGSHGRIDGSTDNWPVLISRNTSLLPQQSIKPTSVFDMLINQVKEG